MATDLYDPGFDEPLLSMREVRDLLAELAETGDFRVVLKAQKFLTHLIDDGHDPATAWEMSGLGRKFGPYEAADCEPVGRMFRGVPRRVFG